MKRLFNLLRTGWVGRYLLFAVFIAIFFSSAMTWVDLDPLTNHQMNVDLLRHKKVHDEATCTNIKIHEMELEQSQLAIGNRQTDGIVFGSAVLVVIIVGGVVTNIRRI